MKAVRLILILLSLCFVLQKTFAAQDLYIFPNAEKKTQFYDLITQLRCLVCQNENLADSNATLAQDLRREIYTMIEQGKSNSEITKYLVDRYGNFILFKPPMNHQTLFLWFAPFLFLGVGVLVLLRVFKYSKN